MFEQQGEEAISSIWTLAQGVVAIMSASFKGLLRLPFTNWVEISCSSNPEHPQMSSLSLFPFLSTCNLTSSLLSLFQTVKYLIEGYQ